MIKNAILFQSILIKDSGSNFSDILIPSMQEQLEQSLIILSLESIDYVFSLKNCLNTLVVFILLSQDCISFILQSIPHVLQVVCSWTIGVKVSFI